MSTPIWSASTIVNSGPGRALAMNLAVADRSPSLGQRLLELVR
jgi:hypothetical protein